MDCGPTCLKMICAYYGKDVNLQDLRERSFLTKEGISLVGLYKAAESLGFRVMVMRLATSNDAEEITLQKAPLPCIVHWDQKHFVVVYKISKTHVWVADPAADKFKIPINRFRQFFETHNGEGIAVLMEPTNAFYDEEFKQESKVDFRYLFGYFRPYRRYTIQLLIGMFVSLVLQLIFPFLTQSIIDVGIANSNLNFILLILISQLVVFSFGSAVNIMQRWILLHMNTRISIHLIYDFLLRIMKLPIPLFDSKNIGDLYQRIEDNKRVETFLSTSFIPFMMGVINFIVFGLVLFLYNGTIFLIYIVGLVLYLIWLFAFMNRRRAIDYIRFQEASENQNTILELLKGMHEIKLQNSQLKRRQSWVAVQARLFKAKIKSLLIANYQDFGGQFINQFKDILIIFVCAREVVGGEMTLGMMLAVQYIIGQLNVPLTQLVEIIRQGQDALLSLNRMNELYSTQPELEENTGIQILQPELADIHIKDLSFKYNELADLVLKDINLTIPHGKTTAIVGTSGSGKTTLLKLLLGFYNPTVGKIKIGDMDFSIVDKSEWRKQCGAVMQEGFIFSDTIASNISESSNTIDKAALLQSVKIANIQEFIENLPLAYNTEIGAKGNGISQGQRQRLLIARAIYKNPSILFFDEATNALDANNERVIVNNLNRVTKDKTVVVVAHRLSTVKNADKIIVLHNGELIEEGTHEQLVGQKGAYFELIKNQLELGN